MIDSKWNKYKESKKNRYRSEEFSEDQYTEFIEENGSNIEHLNYGDYGLEMCGEFRIKNGYWYDDISNNIFYFADDKEYQESGLITKCITRDQFIIDEIVDRKQEYNYIDGGITYYNITQMSNELRILNINREKLKTIGRISMSSEYDDYD